MNPSKIYFVTYEKIQENDDFYDNYLFGPFLTQENIKEEADKLFHEEILEHFGEGKEEYSKDAWDIMNECFKACYSSMFGKQWVSDLLSFSGSQCTE